MSHLLTVFGIDWKMLVVETFNFVVLLGGLSYFLYKPTMKLLKERSEKIAQGIKDADEAARVASEAEVKKQVILSTAEKEAENIVGKAVEEGKNEQKSIVKSAQQRSDTLLSDARAQAEELQRKALAESEKEIARMATLAAEKILTQS